MKKTMIFAMLGLSLMTGMSMSNATQQSDFTVTFVGNAGFLVETGGKKILIDAVFSGLSGGGYTLPGTIRDKLTNAKPPFDNIDLILVTHNHADHFSVSMMRSHLQADPKAIVVSTVQVTGPLDDFGNRVITIAPTGGKPVDIDVAGIKVRGIYLSHGKFPAGKPEIVNVGYCVTVGDFSFFHTGDSDFSLTTPEDLRAQLPAKQLDIGFIEHFYFTTDPLEKRFILEGIGARYLIPMHYEYTSPPLDRGLIAKLFPDAILFAKEMDSWKMP